MTVVYSPHYGIQIGPHVFPTQKYSLVYERLLANGVIGREQVIEPEPAAWGDLALVHTDEYLHKVRAGELSPEEIAELELPWSEAVVEGFRLMTGGTLTATRRATSEGVAVHLGGGFHHAFANHGEGFCLFNDVALAIRVLQRDQGLRRAAVVDCDVHHGNGTAMIFGREPAVFTFSMHQQYNYPAFKPRGSLDIGLRNGCTDEEYLTRLRDALPRVMESSPEAVFYLAGADPYEDDQLGGLSLTLDGLRERDRLVIGSVFRAGAPLVVTLAGGYARQIERTVAIHVATVEEAMKLVN